MSRLSVLFVLAMIISASVASEKASENPAVLADLGDLAEIEALMPLRGLIDVLDGGADTGSLQSEAVRDTFRRLSQRLSSVPAERRAATLRDFANETKWGSPERFVAYYVCAWYGIDYAGRLGYLEHVVFWKEWKIGPYMIDKSGARLPFGFEENGVDLLYRLYEHNLDFGVLHNIVTTEADTVYAQVISGLTASAMDDHPRGLLHVSKVSQKGHKLVSSLLHLGSDDPENPVSGFSDGKVIQNKFRGYVKRVADDSQDPFAPLARDLLALGKR